MVSGSTEPADHTGGREVAAALRAVAGLLLGLALVGGIAGRQLATQQGGTPPAITESRALSVTTVTAIAPTLTVYVTSSQEQAGAVAASIEQANAHRAALGAPPVRYLAIVVGPANGDSVLEALKDDARIVPDGGGSVRLVDLR
jgi:hypothetical protein